MIARVGALLGVALLAGCVRFSYSAEWIEEPLDAVVLESLVAQQDDLESCLAKLGAPHFVWEYRGDGVSLGWVYSDGGSWNASVSYSFGTFRNVSFSMSSTDVERPGAVLWFDEHLHLVEWKEGVLADLVSGLRQRPAPVDDDS